MDPQKIKELEGLRQTAEKAAECFSEIATMALVFQAHFQNLSNEAVQALRDIKNSEALANKIKARMENDVASR
jgi:hypothetical protein